SSMRSVHFNALGANRTYWDFFLGAGFSAAALYFFSAILAWQLGALPAATLSLMRGIAWAFALSFAAIAVVSWMYVFIIPGAFSMAITVCLTAAAWTSARQVAPS